MLFPQSHAWTPAQKCLIAGAVIIGIAACAALVYTYERYRPAKTAEGIEQIEDLGFGFRRITIAQFNKFELGHFPFFYYRNRLLCQIGAPPSISPSGNFAIYQDGRS